MYFSSIFATDILYLSVVSGFITYQISFIYDSGNLKIIKKYPIKVKTLYNGDASALKAMIGEELRYSCTAFRKIPVPLP